MRQASCKDKSTPPIATDLFKAAATVARRMNAVCASWAQFALSAGSFSRQRAIKSRNSGDHGLSSGNEGASASLREEAAFVVAAYATSACETYRSFSIATRTEVCSIDRKVMTSKPFAPLSRTQEPMRCSWLHLLLRAKMYLPCTRSCDASPYGLQHAPVATFGVQRRFPCSRCEQCHAQAPYIGREGIRFPANTLGGHEGYSPHECTRSPKSFPITVQSPCRLFTLSVRSLGSGEAIAIERFRPGVI